MVRQMEHNKFKGIPDSRHNVIIHTLLFIADI